MRVTLSDHAVSLICIIISACIMLFLSYSAFAGEFLSVKTHQKIEQGINTRMDGIDSRIDKLDLDQYSTNIRHLDEQLSGAIATSSAMSAIPTMSHTKGNHSHTSVGVGLGGYNGESGIALGIEYMKDNMSFKGVVGGSTSSDAIIGVGGSFGL